MSAFGRTRSVSIHSTVMNGPRILIIDGYPRWVREKLVEDGATVAAQLYQDTLQTCRSDIVCETVYAADPDSPLPAGTTLEGFDGAVWTGSVVSVTETQNASVQQQIEFTKAVFEAGVPGFGSCFAIQIASVAAGGKVSRNSKGREFGVGRGLTLTEAGHRHPVFDGRAPLFEASMIHEDIVTALPSGGVVLAENHMAPIQAATFPVGRTFFTGVQYHPEFHAAELGAILWRQRKALVSEGFYSDFDAIRTLADDMKALHEDPTRQDLRDKTGIGDDILSDTIRLNEIRNWVNGLTRKA